MAAADAWAIAEVSGALTYTSSPGGAAARQRALGQPTEGADLGRCHTVLTIEHRLAYVEQNKILKVVKHFISATRDIGVLFAYII